METITSIDDLSRLLKKHTGSERITYELQYMFDQDPSCEKYYAYSRGRSTIIFRHSGKHNFEILRILNKVKYSSFINGIDEELLNKLKPYLKPGWRIVGYYRGNFVLHVPFVCTETEICDILELGFIEARVTNPDSTIFFMK